MPRISTAERCALFGLDHIRPIVEAATILLIVTLRTRHAPFFATGMYLCGFGAKILQRVTRQPRPIQTVKKGYGFPSAHASAIAFVGWYTALTAALIGLDPRLNPVAVIVGGVGTAHVVAAEIVIRVVISQSALVLAGFVCWSRHHFSHHTPTQIVAGAVFGTLSSLAWFALWQSFGRRAGTLAPTDVATIFRATDVVSKTVNSTLSAVM